MDRVLVLDFGGQYCHLISRRIRDLGVYSEVLPSNTSATKIKKIPGLKGIVLSGGAASVYDKKSPKCDPAVLELGIPVLGICYGHQLIAHLAGGKVKAGGAGEYGLTEMRLKGKTKLLAGLKQKESVWMNHKDVVKELPHGYSATASTKNSPVAAFEDKTGKICGVQFHPEVTHTPRGGKVLGNFALKICGAKREWDASKMIASIGSEIKQTLGTKKAIIGLSGGIDSTTATVLVSRAIGKNLVAVYVDTGLMRHRETEFIKSRMSRFGLNLRIVDASNRFFEGLKGVTSPEKKRKIIGKLFVDVFSEIAKKEGADVLIQGTIYSDRIESGITKHSSSIKSHHNVGGLPKKMNLEVYEPLRDLYKDEVRKIAAKLGIPREIITRHVFPGPGLGVRIVGEVTEEKAEIARKAQHIVEEELRKANLYEKVWMGFAVLLPVKSVGIQGDARTYRHVVAVRIIESKDAMTANFAKVPYPVLEKISTRITNETPEVNRVVYDISNKPPATMEWE